MIRKMLASATAVAMILVGVLSMNAGASDTCGGYYFGGRTANCAEGVAYPGPFTNHPSAPSGPYGWGTLNVTAAAPAEAAADAATGTGGGLAHTGSESAVIAYVGTGLIAFGAVALGSRRKFF